MNWVGVFVPRTRFLLCLMSTNETLSCSDMTMLNQISVTSGGWHPETSSNDGWAGIHGYFLPVGEND